MNEYKRELRKRSMYFIVGGIICLILFILAVLGILKPSIESHYNSFISGFQCGLSFVILICIVAQLKKYYTLLHDEEKIIQEKIKEEDERLRFINYKTGGWPMMICAYLFIVIGIVSAYFNEWMFGTFIVCGGFLAVFKTVLHSYYSKKY